MTKSPTAATNPASGGQSLSRWNITRNIPLYVMLLPGVIAIFVFYYVPMYGLVIAFQDYQPVHGFWGSPFVGFEWFELAFSMRDFPIILRNTVVIAFYKLILGQLVPIIFALMLNEIRARPFKRVVQTIVYFPHFLSWVIIGGIFIEILSLNGIVNTVLTKIGIEPVFFLGSNAWFRPVIVATDVWKNFGWNAILYLAALTAINPNLYESAAIDGANRWRQTWYITLPGIATTVVLVFALRLGHFLQVGFEQVLMLYNPIVYETGDIIDTYVYRAGLIDSQFSLATAIGLFKSTIGFILIVGSYRFAYKVANYRIF
jgi:putative aldouronate transport system permease protein